MRMQDSTHTFFLERTWYFNLKKNKRKMKKRPTPYFFEMGAYALRSLLSIYASKMKPSVNYSRPVPVMTTVT